MNPEHVRTKYKQYSSLLSFMVLIKSKIIFKTKVKRQNVFKVFLMRKSFQELFNLGTHTFLLRSSFFEIKY